MAHTPTTRNVSHLAHQPTKEKFLSGDVGHGIKSAGKLAKEKKEREEKLAAAMLTVSVDETA